jgi:hypothetical protein
MTRLVGLLAISILPLQLGPYSVSAKDQRLILMRVSDSEVSLQPTAGPNNVGNCMIVYQDGRLHLELRRQEFFSGRASYVSYEGKLTDRDLAFLRSILEGTDVKNLPTPTSPKPPVAWVHIGWFTAEISRGSTVQEVGYFEWNGEPKLSEDDKKLGEKERQALEPLAQWVRSTKSYDRAGWKKVRNANSVCGR